MAWNGLFRRWLQRSDAAENDAEQEIDEELMFHLRSLVDERLASGASFDTAWREAQEKFGSLPRYADACRSIAIKEHVMLQRISVVGLVVLGLVVGWLALELRSLRREYAAVVEASASAPDQIERPAARRNDIVGRVLDRRDQPIAGADVLVILKTWPGGMYHQENFAAKSDAAGRFRLPNLAPMEGQFAIQAAALKDGYALTSSYQLKADGNHPTVDPVRLQLDDASRITLVVHDGRGLPVTDARVMPHSRRSGDGEKHVVYFQASEPIQTASDAEGRVGLACFGRGEQAEIYLRLPGKDWERRAIDIPSDGDVVVVTAVEKSQGAEPPKPDKES